MKWQKMNSVALVASLCAISSVVFARVPMQQNTRLYNQGRLAGRADGIIRDVRLSAQQKEKLLSSVFADYEKLSMTNSTEARQIKAHLGLAQEQVKTVENYVTQADRPVDALPLETLSLEGEMKAPVEAEELTRKEVAVVEETIPGDISIEDIHLYGSTVIKNAAKFSDRLQHPGMPTVSHHRELTFRLYLEAAESDHGLRAQALVAKEVMNELEKERAVATSGLAKFIATFKSHLEKKYGTITDGVEEEIFFKIFQNLAYSSEGDPSVATGVGVFLKKYNEYVQEKFRFSPDELVFSTGDWGRKILDKDKNFAGRLKLLLVSFSMEEIRQDLKREPLIKKLNDAIAVQVKKGVDLLAQEGVPLEEAQAAQPTVVAMKCAEIVKKKIDDAAGQITPEIHKQLQEYFSVADQISYLSNDCDLVAREMADIESVSRIRNEIAGLPVEDQQMIQQSSAIDKAALAQIVPGMGQQHQPVVSHSARQMMRDEDAEEADPLLSPAHRRTGPNKKVMILVAIGVLVAGALLLNKFKPEAFAWFGGRSRSAPAPSSAS